MNTLLGINIVIKKYWHSLEIYMLAVTLLAVYTFSSFEQMLQ